MLDEADFIARYDKGDCLGVVAGQPDQLLHKFELPEGLDRGKVSNIVLTGMGGSALAAEFIENWLGDRLSVPFEIVRDYELPAYVGKESLVVASSYSGNTEETVASLDVALERKAQVVVVAAGGKLVELAKERSLPRFEPPGGLQPRLAVLYGVRAWAQLLEALKLSEGLVDELEAAATWVKGELGVWKADSTTDKNPAKQIAGELVGHPVVVYGGPALRLPAMKWKIDFNENGKNLAFWNILPEMNHNEFIGWANPDKHGLKVVELRSNLDNPRVQKRFDVMNRLHSSRFAPIEVQAEGRTKLEQLLWVLILGDFASAYLAFLNQVDPTPVDLVEKFKKELV